MCTIWSRGEDGELADNKKEKHINELVVAQGGHEDEEEREEEAKCIRGTKPRRQPTQEENDSHMRTPMPS